MNLSLREDIDSRYDLIAQTVKRVNDRLKEFPEGKVKVKKHGERVYYYRFGKNIKERILKKEDSDLIRELLQKSYLEKVIVTAKKELSVLEGLKKHYPPVVVEEIYDKLTEERKKYVNPVFLTDEQFRQRWQEFPFEKKPIKEGMPVFKTMRGEFVRSKSEAMIADRLYVHGIPYKYECPLLIGSEIIHPDFTILRMSDRKILYLEHCGKVGDPEYGDDMVSRANKYVLGGIMQGDKLFFTFETATIPLNTDVVDEMIKRNFR